MPTKRNRAGQQQPYVPAGHGDASGEYGEHATGSNKHWVSPDDVKKQLGYTKPQEKKESGIPKELEDKLNGIRQTEITEEMKTSEYTKKFTQDSEAQGYYNTIRREAEVKITRGSLNKEEIGVLNNEIGKMFEEYPDMQKFTKIIVNNKKASSQGGYIATFGGFGNAKSYDLYINAGWLDKTPGERIKDENIQWYKERIDSITKGLNENAYIESSIDDVKKQLENYKIQLEEYKNKPTYNVITKSKSRQDRLKSLLAHELMHRIYNKNVKSLELEKEIRETYKKALDNGDAQKISTYATTQMSEFISEANSQIVMGIDTPQYIVDIVNKIKGVK